MKIKIFKLEYCFHNWINSLDRYNNKIRICNDCNKKQIKMYNSNKKNHFWIDNHGTTS